MDISGSFITVVTGTAVFVLGQIGLKVVIEPYLEQQKVIAKIVHALVYYANVSAKGRLEDLPEPVREKVKEASLQFRTLASELVAINNFIRGYYFWRFFLFAPSQSDINEASKSLIALSNAWWSKEDLRHEHKRNIETHLWVKTITYP